MIYKKMWKSEAIHDITKQYQKMKQKQKLK